MSTLPKVSGAKEYLLNVFARLKDDCLWAEKGFVVSREQFVVPASTDPVALCAPRSEILIDSRTAGISGWIVDGRNLLNAPLQLYFWKPANDNQRRNGYNERLGAWREAMKEAKVVSAGREGDVARFTLSLLEGKAFCDIEYETTERNTLRVRAHYRPQAAGLPLLPKFGFRCQLAAADTISWYGRGPMECYPDRKTAAFIGQYSMTVDEYATCYVVPQGCSCRTDVRWVSVGGLRFVAHSKPFNVRAWRCDEVDFEKAGHPFQLPGHDYVTLNIDEVIHGVGGNDSWGARTLDAYTVPGNEERMFEFEIVTENR